MHSITLEQRLGDRVSSFQGEDVTGAVWTSLNIEISCLEISLNGLIARYCCFCSHFSYTLLSCYQLASLRVDILEPSHL